MFSQFSVVFSLVPDIVFLFSTSLTLQLALRCWGFSGTTMALRLHDWQQRVPAGLESSLPSFMLLHTGG